MVNIFFGIAIYTIKPKGKVNKTYAWLSFFICLWLFGEMMMQRTILGAEAEFWAKFSFIGLSFLPSILLELSTFYPIKRRFFQNITNFRLMIYAPSFIFLFLAFSSKVLVKGLTYQNETFFISYGNLFPFYTAYFSLSLMIALINAIDSHRATTSGLERKQLSAFVVGLAVFLLAGAFVDMVPFILGFGQYKILNMASIISMGFLGFAVAQHGLEDIRPTLESLAKKTGTWSGEKVNPGRSYLIQETQPQKGYKIFTDAIHQGWYGLCFSRELPEKIRERYEITTTPVIWLTEIDSKDPALRPQELEMISHTISEFIDKSENSIILIDALEYMVTYNKFTRVLRMTQHIRDMISTKKAIMIITLNPSAIDPQQLQLLLRELETL
ncbi:MAG: DUF835 domain-containing protein [Candidatus Altiarchaeota archaeon]